MKKMKISLLCLVGGLFATSCTLTQQTVTNNPVGTKTGVAKGTVFSKDLDISYATAAKNGKINKIGVVEFKTTFYGPIAVFKTTVWGE